jgi:hypothetical protein
MSSLNIGTEKSCNILSYPLNYAVLLKKKNKFASYIRKSDGISCMVIYEEGLPNI